MIRVGKPATRPPDLVPDAGSGADTSGGAGVTGGRVCGGAPLGGGTSLPDVGVPSGAGPGVPLRSPGSASDDDEDDDGEEDDGEKDGADETDVDPEVASAEAVPLPPESNDALTMAPITTTAPTAINAAFMPRVRPFRVTPSPAMSTTPVASAPAGRRSCARRGGRRVVFEMEGVYGRTRRGCVA
jgi:hypothetical protein